MRVLLIYYTSRLEDEMPFNGDETFQLWSQVGDEFLSDQLLGRVVQAHVGQA